MPHTTLKTQELSVIIGDNAVGCGDCAEHKAGYNGIWSLTSQHFPHSCFVPMFSGLNLEHYMDDLFMSHEGGDIFEPRQHSMHLERDGGNAVRLIQDLTPQTGISSETTFFLQEPHVIDMTFRATFHQPPRAGRRIGFFWASYIDAPDFPTLQFINDAGVWSSLNPDDHGHDGGNTVCHASTGSAAWWDTKREYNMDSLAHSISKRRFSIPLMFGRPGDGSMLFLQMFDQLESLRLCMSPTGGGLNVEKRIHNPAWDFQFIVEDAKVGTACSLRSRLIYKQYVNRSEIEDLYRQWQDEILVPS